MQPKIAFCANNKNSTNGKVAILVQGGLHIGNTSTFVQKNMNVFAGRGQLYFVCDIFSMFDGVYINLVYVRWSLHKLSLLKESFIL